jgi:hypothetical protein
VNITIYGWSTKQPVSFSPDPDKPLGEYIRRRLATWKNKQGFPKRPPKDTLSYDEWDAKKAALGEYDVRERRKSATRVQLETVQQARDADERRRRARVRDAVEDSRRRDEKTQAALDALYEIGPQDKPKPGADVPITEPDDRHERLIEGISYLEATDATVIRWLRTLIEMDPEKIGPEAGKVTRIRMRDARVQASLAALEQTSRGGQELSGIARILGEYVSGAPDFEAGQEVRELWQVLRSAIRDHARRGHTPKTKVRGQTVPVRWSKDLGSILTQENQ